MWPGVHIRSGFVHIIHFIHIVNFVHIALLWATVNGFTNKFCIQETMSRCLFSFLHHFILVYICLPVNQHFRNPFSFYIFFWLKIDFALCCSTLLFSSPVSLRLHPEALSFSWDLALCDGSQASILTWTLVANWKSLPTDSSLFI